MSSDKGRETSLTGVQLNNKHRYFTQVQHQMFVCGKQEKYFYVYTTKDAFTEKLTLIQTARKMWKSLNISLIITYVQSFSQRRYCLK